MSRLIASLLLLFMAVPAFGQGELIPWVPMNFPGASGAAPNANGFVCTYAAGTSTPLATYSDVTITSANQNPIRLNSAGRPSYMSSEFNIYLGQASYKFSVYGPGTGNSCNGTTVGSLLYSRDNIANLAQLYALEFATKMDDKVCHASQYTGANAGAKIIACIAALPSTGGTIDARGIEGTQTATSTITLSKPIQLIIGAMTLTSSASPGFNLTSAGASIVGDGQGISTLKSGANATLINIAAGATTIRDISLDGNSGSFATAKGIVLTSGHSQFFDSLRMTGWGGVPFEVTADQGIFMMLTDSLIQPTDGTTTNAIVITGTDTTPTHRHFTDLDTGGAPIDIQGAETTILTSVTARNISMTSSSKKLMLSNSRFTSALAITTIAGINHSIIGNVFAGPLTIGASVTGSTIGPNVTVGPMVNNTTDYTNILCDHNSYCLVPKLAVGITATPAGVGTFIRPAAGAMSGTSQYGLQVAPEATSAATAEAAGIVARSDTAASAFTVAQNYAIYAANGTKGSGSTITNNYGLYIAAQTIGNSTNYGFYSAHTGAHHISGTLTNAGLITGSNGLSVQGSGVLVGAATGGDKGAGTINVSGDLYKNNTAYTNPDYVFEKYFKGHIRKFIDSPGAKSYTGLMSLSDLKSHVETNHQLPGVAAAKGMFERSDIILEKLEEAYLYILELNARIERLEKKQ